MMKKIKPKCFDLLYAMGSIFPNRSHPPILVYHSIDDSGSRISVSESEFKKQMHFLKENGYNCLSLDEYIKQLTEKKPPPRRSFILTFDDGYENTYSAAFHVIRELGFTATVFLTTGYIGKLSSWIEEDSIPHFSMMNWDQARAMANAGISFAPHTATHPDLTRCSTNEIYNELSSSRDAIHRELGEISNIFCYPYGFYDEKVVEAVQKCDFNAACSLNPGINNSRTSPFSLKRCSVEQGSDFSFFKFIFSGFLNLNVKRKQICSKACRNRDKTLSCLLTDNGSARIQCRT